MLSSRYYSIAVQIRSDYWCDNLLGLVIIRPPKSSGYESSNDFTIHHKVSVYWYEYRESRLSASRQKPEIAIDLRPIVVLAPRDPSCFANK